MPSDHSAQNPFRPQPTLRHSAPIRTLLGSQNAASGRLRNVGNFRRGIACVSADAWDTNGTERIDSARCSAEAIVSRVACATVESAISEEI